MGWTWLAASAQGTGINAEAKFLLFRYAFETLGVAVKSALAVRVAHASTGSRQPG